MEIVTNIYSLMFSILSACIASDSEQWHPVKWIFRHHNNKNSFQKRNLLQSSLVVWKHPLLLLVKTWSLRLRSIRRILNWRTNTMTYLKRMMIVNPSKMVIKCPRSIFFFFIFHISKAEISIFYSRIWIKSLKIIRKKSKDEKRGQPDIEIKQHVEKDMEKT